MISDYLVKFAKMYGLLVIQDRANNVIIKKPGTLGYEQSPVVVLQGHLDMVGVKKDYSSHDFDKDPIELVLDGNSIRAKDTSLGADNGIGIAYCLAILASDDIPHPPLEVVFTTEEESGMSGVASLDPGNITGRTLINIDGEDEGTFFAGCAGGIRNEISVEINWEKRKENFIPYTVTISGLKGGHSGLEIDKGRGNSNKLMGRILNDINGDMRFYLSEVNGGTKMNAIPAKTEAVVLIDKDAESKLQEKISEWDTIFKNELKSSDENVLVEFRKTNIEIDKVFSKETTDKVIYVLVVAPNGVQTMSMDIKDLVQSSTNLGVVSTGEKHVVFTSNVRSSIKSLKYEIIKQIEQIARIIGAKTLNDSEYPEWQYDPNSRIREIFKQVYKKLYNSDPQINITHGGLECGYFKEKFADMDIISFGPNIRGVHTPNESLDIPSVQRTWDFLLKVLSSLK